MDRYRISSLALQGKRGARDAAGKATGAVEAQGPGKVDKTEGKAQDTADRLSEKAPDAIGE